MSNFEIKVCDGCANPYLALASIVAAGIDGLRRHLRLPKPVGKTTPFFKIILPISGSCSAITFQKNGATGHVLLFNGVCDYIENWTQL